MPRTILLNGRRLTRTDFHAVVLENHRVGLSPRARLGMQRSRALVEKLIAEKQVVYGVTTGVGSLSTERIDPAKVRDAIEQTHNFMGTAGKVNMSAQDHLGLTVDAFRMLEIKNGDWLLVD